MKNVDKMSECELRSEIRGLRGLLSAAKCPNCSGQGFYTVCDGDFPEQVQCQWCAERSELIGQDSG